MRLARALAVVVALALVGAACQQDADGGNRTPSPTSVPSVRESPSQPPSGEGSAAAALERLCDYGPPPGSEPPPAEGPTPDAVAEVQEAVEELRGLDFTERVVADSATRAELVDGLEESFDYSFPEELLGRRSRAWQAIGVIPPETSIRDELEAFASGQVIGYYDTLTGELVFIGTDDPSPVERVTLAHELTHAIDDQNFGLERLDVLLTSCRDEAASAAVALVEGNATYFMTAYAFRYLTPEEQLSLGEAGGGEQAEVAPFVERQQVWPYVAGQTFVTALSNEGGVDAIDEAFRDLPVSTEQILHPERYPNDVPTPVDVTDLAPALGSGWEDLDVQEVGEAWLLLALDLRLETGTAEDAAAGWDGGVYRAWTDGEQVAVVLSTVWDSAEDASAFADAMREWIAGSPDGQAAAVLPVEGSSVRALFASDAAALEALRAAA
jgi:acyl carrier protein